MWCEGDDCVVFGCRVIFVVCGVEVGVESLGYGMRMVVMCGVSFWVFSLLCYCVFVGVGLVRFIGVRRSLRVFFW